MVERDLISVAEAARLLDAPETEIWQRIADGVLTQYRRAREVLVDRNEIEKIRP